MEPHALSAVRRTLPALSYSHQAPPSHPTLSSQARRIGYVSSEKCIDEALRIAVHRGRERLVHALIASYGLLERMIPIDAFAASDTELEAFHSSDYVQCLKKAKSLKGNDTALDEEHGLAEDCPLFAGVYDYVRLVAGSSLAAARAIVEKKCDVALNWFGGRHHEASGYCYVNDIVLAILELMPHFDRILYVDLDVHHGDGVEEAFASFSDVVTLSVHLRRPGFFPGSGSLSDVGLARGKYHTLNIPLLDGIDDTTYCSLFNTLFGEAMKSFKPSMIVLQCGADSLAGDPLGGFNLSSKGLVSCVERALKQNLPTLVLGGGGYVPANAARLWTAITAATIGVEIPSEIPDHDYFELYKPGFSLHVPALHMPNRNPKEAIADLMNKALAIIAKMGTSGATKRAAESPSQAEDSSSDEKVSSDSSSDNNEGRKHASKKQAVADHANQK